MTFQAPLPYHKESESNLPPNYIAIHPAGLHNPINVASTPARNYVFEEKTGKEEITGIFHINTDLSEPFGLFDTDEERDQAPNLFLQASYIDIDIVVSGGKKANITLRSERYSTDYSRFIIRLHTDGETTSMTPVNIKLSQRDSGRALVAIMQPQAFKGFIEGAAQVSKAVMEVASNLLVPADVSRVHMWYSGKEERTRWLLLPDTYALNDLAGGDTTTRKASFSAEASKLVWDVTRLGTSSRAAYHARRKVCFNYEYETLRETLVEDEARTKSRLRAIGVVWKAALAGVLIWASWILNSGNNPLPWMAVFSIVVLGLVAGVAEAFEFVC